MIFENGITPARAGKTCFRALEAQAEWDHPRACGGKRKLVIAASGKPRITPARAGENLEWFPLADLEMGSPPRVRGKTPSGVAG